MQSVEDIQSPYRVVLFVAMAFSGVFSKDVLSVEIVTIGGNAKTNSASLVYLGPAMSVAVEQANAQYNLLNFSLTYVFDDMPWLNLWTNEVTVRMASQWYYRQHNPQRLSVLIIPVGNIVPDMLYLLRQWNILYITVISVSSAIGDRNANPTWISTARLNYPAMATLFCEVLLKYNWTTVMTILDLGSGEIYKPYLERILECSLITIGHTPLQRAVNLSRDHDFQPLLDDIRSHTRIVIFLGSGGSLRNFLLAAHQRNMTNGDYVYMAFEVLNGTKLWGFMHWKYHDEKDPIARQAFQSLLIMRPVDVFDDTKVDLAESFISRTRRDFNLTYTINEQPFQTLLSAYVAVTSLAEVLHDFMKKSSDYLWLDGSFLAKQFLNRTFNNSAMEMTIDNRGSRQLGLYMWRFDENGEQKTFLYKDAAKNSPVTQMYDIQTWANGTWPPSSEPVCGFRNDRLACRTDGPDKLVVPLSVSAVAALCVVTALIGLWYIKRANRKELETWWRISEDDLAVQSRETSTVVSFYSGRKSILSGVAVNHLESRFHSATLKGLAVIFEDVHIPTDEHTLDRIASNRSILSAMDKLRVASHPNISRFYGIFSRHSVKVFATYIVLERPARGCIYDVFDGLILLDMTLISSLMMDFLEGVGFIHSSTLVYHGCLCGAHCHVDKHFTLKISGTINTRLHDAMHSARGDYRLQRGCFDCFTGDAVNSVEQQQKVDIFAVGVVLWELLCKRKCSSLKSWSFNPSKFGHYEHANDDPAAVHAEENSAVESLLHDCYEVFQLCWSDDFDTRPSVKEIQRKLAEKAIIFAPSQSGTRLIDKVLKRLSEYARELENEVGMRTKDLIDEMAKCNEIVAQFLPRWVASQIRSGKPVSSELFECATIMFTQTCGFSALVKDYQPKTVIDLIDELETIVDCTVAAFNDEVYKVEAVDDSFLFTSGLPVRNGARHADIIAELAIKLSQSQPGFFQKFDLSFKSGVHTGPCAAGIVGFRRLRYCLFGDTVNTASRMCSHGLPNRIQLTSFTASMVAVTERFAMEYRGSISIKGKDTMGTYWLNGFAKE